MASERGLETKVLPIDVKKIGRISTRACPNDILDEIIFALDGKSSDVQNLKLAAEQLRTSSTPVAFGTETVYGLGADATRKDAVLGIYKAKQRPLDNPLIVHIASLKQLRQLLQPSAPYEAKSTAQDPIPRIYKPLIRKFWPGPLTIICSNPVDSPLVQEVTAGLSTFGARMPSDPIALALITLADAPIAAPSANASTKPSPTAAEHVLHDLNGRIAYILDSGPCDVGVESTVVDGLSCPPAILRPGGISLEQIRTCPGWEATVIGYKNVAEKDGKPRAPGMKYRHYSPKAPVVLFESAQSPPSLEQLLRYKGAFARIGLVRTKTWVVQSQMQSTPIVAQPAAAVTLLHQTAQPAEATGFARVLAATESRRRSAREITTHMITGPDGSIEVADTMIGPDTADVARGIFAALRDLDRRDVDAIFVEGIADEEGDRAAAVMNRVRKAAEITIDS